MTSHQGQVRPRKIAATTDRRIVSGFKEKPHRQPQRNPGCSGKKMVWEVKEYNTVILEQK
ncbi:unnamed protein product [Staurois parvus]|uniref:Uncharacterized protein n=1 Tax=Staurois parvus TaxID=386267 RepID=A0ABN9BRZ1_9NEOB|nr:unnamed protein product [Staurois parvus]